MRQIRSRLPYFLFLVWASVGLILVPAGVQTPLGGWADLLFLVFAAAVLLRDEVRSLGRRRAASRFLLIAVISGAAEAYGVKTGNLFGEYRYTTAWGPMIGGTLPLAVPLAWYVLTIPIQRVVCGGLRPGVVIPIGATLLVLCDLVLDPVATLSRGYWEWLGGGSYYGVPWSNFLGWWITGVFVITASLPYGPGRLTAPGARNRALTVLGFTVGLFGLTALMDRLGVPALIGLPFLVLVALRVRGGWREAT